MQYNRLNDPNALLKLIKALEQRVSSVETRGTGPIGFVGSDGVELHIGVQPDGQAAIIPFVGDVTPPPIATSPDASAGPGFITVTWDGLFVNGEAMPLDFEHLNVVGSRIVNGVSDLTVEVGIIRNPMDSCLVGTDVAAVGETWEFVFVSEDYNGNLSSISAKSEQVVQKSFAADVLIDEALEGLQQDFISAQNAAASAQQAADAAQDAADEAALILTSKGAIYSQSETPDADPNGLWIDTGHSNVPRRYLGTGKALAVHVGGGASAGTRLTALGWTVTTVTAMPTLEEASEYDLVAFDAGYAGLSSAYGSLASSLLDKGVSVFSSGNDTTNLPPLFTGGLTRGTPKNTIRPVGTHEAATGWAEYSDGDLNYYLTGVKSDAIVTGVTLVTSLGTDQPLNIVWEHPTTFARWAHVETYASPVSVLNAHMGWIADNWIAIQDQSVVASIAAAQLKADQAFNNAATAATAAGTAQTTADSKNRSWYQDDQPAGTSHKVGDSWYDTNDGYKLRTWTGSIWQTTQDSALAQQIAESKGRTYTQAVAPPVEARNDKNLWIDTSLGEGLYVTKYWNGTIWTALTSKDASDAQDLAESKGETIYSSTEPAAAKRLPQNTWIDTSGGLNIQKRWDGNAWVVVVDSRIPSTASAVTALDVRVDGVSAATSFEISEIETRVDTVSAVAESKGEIIYSSTTPPASKALPQNQWVDTTGGLNIVKRWNTSTGTWVIASDQRIDANAAAVTAVDTRVTSVSAAASGQILSVDSRVTGVSAAAASGISTVDARVTSVSATASSEATAKADAAAASAISSQAYSNNASFDNWTSTFPVGYANWSATPIKETSIVKRAPYSMRFNVADATAQHGVSWSSIMAHAPNLEFFTVEVDLYLVSGTLDGSGMILDWAGMTNNRAQIQFASELPGAVTGKWYRVSKVLRRPTNATGTWTAMTGYLMGQWSGHGTGAAKNIIFDWFNVRPSTVEEILSYKAPTTQDLTAVDTRVTGVSAAASSGITTVDTRVTGVSAAANTQINNVDTRVTGVSAAADAELTVIDTRVTGVSSTASTQIGTVDSRVTGVSAAASTQIGTVDSRVTGVSSTASTQIGAVDSRVTGVSAAAGSAISTVDARVTGVSSATNLALASVQADIDQVWASSRSYVNDATSAQDIQVMNGIAPTVATSASAMGGKALQKAGTSHGWWHDNRAKQAYDPTALYRLSLRVRVVTPQSNGGGKGLYWGFAGLAADGTTFVNATGANSYSSQQWAYNNTQVPTDGSWVDYVAYYRGLSATTPSGAGTSVQTARLMHADTRYVVPSMLIDYNAGNGVWEVSHWSIDVIDAAGYASLIEASNKSVTYYEDNMPTGGTYKKGDLWIDTNDGNKIYAHNGTTFVSAQDTAITSAATSASAAMTAANGKNKIIWSPSAATGTTGYSAGDIWFQTASGIVTGQWEFTNAWQVRTIDNAVIANLNAGKITAGTLAADRIGANTIAANKLVLGDLTNLASDGNFQDLNKLNWIGSGVVTVSAGEANRLMITTAASGNNDQSNRNTFQVSEGEQFYGEMWAYGAPTNVGGGGPNLHLTISMLNGTTQWPTFGNLTRAAVSGQWVKISGSVTIPAGAKTAKVEPAIGFSADAVGNVYYIRDVVVRRKNSANLIVDGAIQANSAIIANGAIGNAQIADLNADKITAGTIAAGRLNAEDIRTKLIEATTINAVDIISSGSISSSTGVFGVLDASSINAGTLAADRLDANTIRAKLLSAAKINAVDIIASGSISSSSGVFGDINASAITSGTLSAARIGAGSITASALSVTMGGNNLVTNSSFEADSNSDGLADGWSVWTRGTGDAGRVFTNTRVAGLFPGSTWAQRVTSTTVTNTEQSSIQATTLFAIKAGDTATLSLYGRASVAGNFSISMRCEDDAAVYKGDANFTAAFTTTTQRFAGIVVIPAGTTRAKVTITTPNSLSNGHWFEVDGVKVELGDVVSAWSPMTAELLPGTINATMLTADAINGKVITGSTVQTEATASRGIKLTTAELAGYDGSGVKNFSLTSTGTLTLRGSLLSGSSIQGASVSASGIYTNASPTAGVKLSDTGIKAYNGSGALSFHLDATTGLLEVPGLKANAITSTMISATAIDGKTITGATVQTETTANRGIKLTSAELAGYDGSGVKNFSLTSGGSLALRGDLLSGSTITGATLAASGGGIVTTTAANRGVKLQDTGITTYDSVGNITFKVDAATGLVEAPGLKAGSISSTMISATAIDGKTITGATVQTEATANRGIKLTSAELAGYDAAGVKNLSLTSAGALYLRGEIKSGSTIEGARLTGTQGIETSTVANTGVKINNVGIKAYDAGNNLTFHLDATTGMLEVPGLKANSITGDKVAADTISTRNLLLTDLTNHVENPLFETGTLAGWTVTGGWFVNNSSAQEGTYKALTQYSGAEQTLVNNAQVYLNALDKVKVKLYVWTDAPTSGTRLTIGLSNVSGGASEDVQTPAITNGAWTEITVTLTATTAGYKKLRLATTGVGTGFVRVDNIRMFKMGMGNMIVDGAITTDHMTSGTIDGGVISAGTLTSTEIKAKSLTVDDLVVTSTDNLVVEADFGNGGTSWDLGAAYKFIMAGRGQGGTDALRIVGSTAEVKSRNLANKIAVDPENRYRAEISVRSTEAMLTGTVKMYLRCYTTPIVYTDVLVMSNEAPLVVNTWTKITAMLPELPPGTLAVEVIIAAHNQSDTTWTEFDYVSMTRAMDASLVVDGSITAAKIDAGAVNANHIAAGSITASALDVEELWADESWLGEAGASSLKLVSSSAPTTALDPATGYVVENQTYSEVNSQGLKVYNLNTLNNPVSGDIVDVQKIIQLGTFEDDFFAINKAGIPQISMDSDGKIASQSLEVGTSANDGSLKLNGVDLGPEIFMRPRGMMAWGQVPINTNMSVASGGEIGLFEIAFDGMTEPARMYEFNVNNFLIDTGSAGITGLRLRYTTNGTQPTINSPLIGFSYFRHDTAGLTGTGQFTRLIGSNNGDYIRVLVSLYTGASWAKVYNGTGQTYLYSRVMDLGETIEPTAIANTAGGTPYTGSPAVPPAPAKVTKTVEWGYNGVRSYTGSNTHYNYNTSKGYQGLSPAGYGNLKSIYTFPDTIYSTVQNSTINGVWLYAYFEHWYNGSGGTAIFRLHGNTSLPSTNNLSGSGMSSSGWPRAAGRWVAVPSTLWGGFLTGAYKGFGFAGDGTYNTYGIANNARIRIKYTK